MLLILAQESETAKICLNRSMVGYLEIPFMCMIQCRDNTVIFLQLFQMKSDRLTQTSITKMVHPFK